MMFRRKPKPHKPTKEELDKIRGVVDIVLNTNVNDVLSKYGVITRMAWMIGYNTAKKLGIGIAYSSDKTVKAILSVYDTKVHNEYCRKLKALLLSLYIASQCNKPTTKEMKNACNDAIESAKAFVTTQYQRELIQELLGIDISKINTVRDAMKLVKYLNPRKLGKQIAETIVKQVAGPEAEFREKCQS